MWFWVYWLLMPQHRRPQRQWALGPSRESSSSSKRLAPISISSAVTVCECARQIGTGYSHLEENRGDQDRKQTTASHTRPALIQDKTCIPEEAKERFLPQGEPGPLASFTELLSDLLPDWASSSWPHPLALKDG
ncbi:hypothetical protein DPEC_G00212050 [Dallia pectoralis]|uniref:Uncharacterized protein n=1 Tax=Dallia pectoralis TaxID=75939 RepID=A0ACC2G5U8_DALPE|nr:hypothetical protein DPEC_G00212050 [Dallia pectoralis]